MIFIIFTEKELITMDTKMASIYASEQLLDMLERVQLDRDYASKIKIVDDLFNPNMIIRKSAFTYLNDFIRRFYKDIEDIEKKRIQDDKDEVRDRKFKRKADISETKAESALIRAKLKEEKKREDDFNAGNWNH